MFGSHCYNGVFKLYQIKVVKMTNYSNLSKETKAELIEELEVALVKWGFSDSEDRDKKCEEIILILKELKDEPKPKTEAEKLIEYLNKNGYKMTRIDSNVWKYDKNGAFEDCFKFEIKVIDNKIRYFESIYDGVEIRYSIGNWYNLGFEEFKLILSGLNKE